MRTITALCGECGQLFQQSRKSFNRAEVLKTIHCCSPSCRGKWSCRKSPHCPPGGISNFHGKRGVRNGDEWSVFRCFITRARAHVKMWRLTKEKEVNLTPQYLKQCWEEQKGVCPFTGWKLLLPKRGCLTEWEEGPRQRRASLDRIDATRGYIVSNVRFVCMQANFAKNEYSDDELDLFFDAIAQKRNIPLLE